MKYSKYIIVILFFTVVFSCTAEEKIDHFEGTWCVKSQTRKITEFIIIQKIEGSYLVITADTDDDGSVKSIGKNKNDNSLEVELRGNNYTLEWDKDEKGEWLTMYISLADEHYIFYERIETFTLDKF